MPRLDGQVAIVTGASRGIGLAIARRFVEEGARVCLTARHEQPLEEAAAGLGGPEHAIAVAGRADDPGHQAATLERTLARYGRLDIMVNNTGINPVFGPLLGTELTAVASVAGLRPAPGLGVYAVSKAALIHLTGQLALELAPKVRVNAIAPAVVKTRFATALYEGRESEVVAGYPLGRLGVPTDVAAAAAFLASADAAWITGQTLVLDGGAQLTGGL
jgi:NAD(P)-dependent dehydrogenase (short-subunit alcohol dehydrogenase family)